MSILILLGKGQTFAQAWENETSKIVFFLRNSARKKYQFATRLNHIHTRLITQPEKINLFLSTVNISAFKISATLCRTVIITK